MHDPLLALALAARDGDRRALDDLVRATQADAWRFCAHLVDTASADDLVQDTYLRMMSALPRFQAGSTVLTWLLAIARHACHDELRRRIRRRGHETGTEIAPRVASDPSGHIAMTVLIAALDADRREAFVLTQVFGMSYDEAATVCECAVGTIRSHVARARSDLIAMTNEPGQLPAGESRKNA